MANGSNGVHIGGLLLLGIVAFGGFWFGKHHCKHKHHWMHHGHRPMHMYAY